jgi:hypothetical protein
MVVKFFSNKNGGGTGAIDYLLDKKRVALKQAMLLKGNEELTRKLIELIDNKQKLTVGCLSFSEENIDKDLKFKLMDEFELMLLAGLDPEQYNILWVEHTDKGRLELNFAIPKLELSTKKALQPYYHKSDLPRLEMWQDMTNLKYGFSNPKDPKNQRNVNTTKVEISKTKSYESLNRQLQQFVKEGKIKNRNHVISLLEKNNIRITRKSDNYISLKLPNSKKARRFKGDIYTSRFTSLDSLNIIKEEQEEEIEDFKNLDVDSEIVKLSIRLEKYAEDKAIKNKKKYPYTPEPEEELEDIEMHYTGGQGDDSIGEEIIGRIREERSLRQDAHEELRNSYLKSLKGSKRTRGDVEQEFRENAEYVVSENGTSTRGVQSLFDRIIGKIGELGGKVEQFISSIKEKIESNSSSRKIRRNR